MPSTKHWLFAFFLLFFLPATLSFSVCAHNGRTDASGGHTDSATGDYHYHHGYPAHAHFDIDGDGVIDCPYDFVDMTNYSSGSSSTSSGKRTAEDGYQNGYEDGYRKGRLDGYDEGYTEGFAEAQEESEKQLRSANESHRKEIISVRETCRARAILLSICGYIIVGIIAIRIYSRKKDALEQQYINGISTLSSKHAHEIDRLNKFHEAQIQEENHKADVRLATLSYSHESEVKRLNLEITNLKRFSLLDKIAAGQVPSIRFPDDVHLKQSFTPIKGKPTSQRPYGDYTVFVTASSAKYHCNPNCVRSGKPLHFFDLPSTAEPCYRCVPLDMFPQPLPDWYIDTHKMLDEDFIDALSNPYTTINESNTP